MPKENKSITRSDTFNKDFAELEEISKRALKSHMSNKKIKEILRDKINEGATGFYVELTQVNQAMQEYGEFVRQQTLEEAIKCVPKEKFCQTQPMVTDYANINNALLVEGVNKWNDCRQKTLSNLQSLKDNK